MRERKASPQQRRLERAGDRGAALAGLRGVADHDDLLSGPRERAQRVAGRVAGRGGRTSRGTPRSRRLPRRPGQWPAPRSSSAVASRRGRSDSARRSRSRCGRTARAGRAPRRRRCRSGTSRPSACRPRPCRRRSARTRTGWRAPPETAAPCRHSGRRRRRAPARSNTVTRVALGDERRVGEAGRAGADHRDALALRRTGASANSRLAAGRAVDDAAQLRAAAHLVDAGVAGEAAADRLAARELVDPFGIGDQRAAERDEIRLAARDRIGRGLRDRRAGRPRSPARATCRFTCAA